MFNAPFEGERIPGSKSNGMRDYMIYIPIKLENKINDTAIYRPIKSTGIRVGTMKRRCLRTDGFIRWYSARVINNMQVRLVLKDDPVIAKESRICETQGGRESS